MSKRRGFVLVVGLPAADEVAQVEVIRKTLKAYAEVFTAEQLAKGIMEWPDGQGKLILLPGLVEEGNGAKTPSNGVVQDSKHNTPE